MDIPRIIDRRSYALRRARASESFLSRDVGQNLAERLGAVNRRFARGLDLGTREDAFELLAPLADGWTRTSLAPMPAAHVLADEEALPFAPASFDLVTSVLSLHAINDLPGALAQIRRVLKPDGLFVGALFGGETLVELRNAFAAGEIDVTGGASPRVAPMSEVRALGGLLQRAGFALPVADLERTAVRYRAFATLVADLRALGETNVLTERSRHVLRRDVLGAALAHLAASDPDGLFPATFDVIYLTAWSPHDSQQKPLRPGSAQHRLADALGTHELSAGDVAAQAQESDRT